MLKRHNPVILFDSLVKTGPKVLAGSTLSAQQLKRAEEIKREIKTLKAKLAQALGIPE